MERRGFLGTIMGAAAAVFAPIPVGENKLAQYAAPLKPMTGIVGCRTFSSYTGYACSGLLITPEIERDVTLNTLAKDHIDEVTRFELGDI